MAAPRRIFLTGATGFIGGRLAKAFAERGDRLLCLARSPARAGPLEALGAEIISGEITDAIALARGLAGADLAIHIAAKYSIGPGNVRDMERINVSGTRCLLEEAARAGTPRLVHVSSTVALGPSDAPPTGDPCAAWGGPHPTAYHRTKAEAHAAVRQAQARGQPAIIVCPANVYGPGDEGPNAGFIRDLLRGRLPALPTQPGRFSWVHVDDVAAGIVAAADRGDPGACYVLGGELATLNEFAVQVTALAGRRPPPLRLPVGVIRATGMALDLVSAATRLRFTISRESVDATTRHDWVHDHAATSRALGWTPRPLSDGLPGTVQWFREHPG